MCIQIRIDVTPTVKFASFIEKWRNCISRDIDLEHTLLQLECTADAWLMKEVCEVWNVSQYCELTGDTTVLHLTAEVPLSHTLSTISEVFLVDMEVCEVLNCHQMAMYGN
jgi:hypothetical protein